MTSQSDRGEKNVRTLHAAYATLFKNTIGLKKFQDFVKLLTKRGEKKRVYQRPMFGSGVSVKYLKA